ncbi:hypothetical protein ACI2K4_00185 [Micromonospora sp. NPDC050397]|uniref:hypothetical protein n=1 Tax=Micromonospora sp. NPDC050397 TaxID=3364279 RepID=UPI00384E27B1
MNEMTKDGQVAEQWDRTVRHGGRLHSPLATDGWAWRLIPPDHPALQGRPSALRMNDPGEALEIISEQYGQPEYYCVLGGNVASVSGWTGISFDEQYQALARGTGAFPCGGMYYCSVRGPDAVRVLGALTPRRVDLLDVGQAAFAVFTTPEGTVDTEGVVLRDGEDSFQISLGGDTRPPRWLHDALDSYPRAWAEETDLSSFNLKGPHRDQAMLRLLADDAAAQVLQLPPFHGARVGIRWGGEAWVLRTVIGIEMWGGPDVIREAWKRMVADPRTFTPCGWEVLATYRLECREFRFYLCPLDIHRGTYLLDAGLGHVVSRGKREPYVGRGALENPEYFSGQMWVGGLTALSPGAPRRAVGEMLTSEARDIPSGYVTSAAYSPRAGREICFAHLSNRVAPGSTVGFGDGSTWRAVSLPLQLPNVVPGRGY